MTPARLLALSLLGASALLACGAGTHNGPGGSGTGGGATASGPGPAAGSSSASTSGSGGVGGGVVFNFDAGAGDAAMACKHLNIGIFGNPGSDPSANFQQWLTLSGTSVQRIQTTAGVPITAATLQPFDVVILDWLTRDYSASEASIFAAWIAAGGGIATMSGYDNNPTDDWHANSLIAPLEVAYSGPLLNGPVTTFAAHPITAGLTSVTFAGGYAISDLGGTASTRTPIAFLPQGSPNVTVGYAIEMGAGHAFVWGDEWIEFDSEWSMLPQIKQLWVQVFAWISPTSACALQPPP